MPDKKYKICIIPGSVRPDNYTMKACKVIANELGKFPEIEYEIIDLSQIHLPLPGQAGDNEEIAAFQEKVKSATGIILATPEYHGGMSSVIKLAIENLGFPSILSAKTVALVGVAAGSIGAIKSLEQLRSVCAHIGSVVLPGLDSVANVHEAFECKQAAIGKRRPS